MKFIHTGDLHLEKTFTGVFNSTEVAELRRKDLWKSLENIVDIANGKGADFLLIGGDLFEKSEFTKKDTMKLMEILSALEKTVVVIAPGNHDFYSDNSPYKMMEKEHYVFKEDRHTYFDFPEQNVRIHGFAWKKDFYQEEFQLKEEYILDSCTNILLIHSGIDKSDYLKLNLDKLKKFDYVALSHVHKREQVSENAFYAGSPEPLAFKEVYPHGVVLYDDGSVEYMECNIRSIVVKKISCEGLSLKDIMAKIEAVAEENRDNIVRLVLTGRSPYYNVNNFEPEIYRDNFYVEVVSELEPEFDIEELFENNRDNGVGEFISLLKEEGTPEAKRALLIGLEAIFGG